MKVKGSATHLASTSGQSTRCPLNHPLSFKPAMLIASTVKHYLSLAIASTLTTRQKAFSTRQRRLLLLSLSWRQSRRRHDTSRGIRRVQQHDKLWAYSWLFSLWHLRIMRGILWRLRVVHSIRVFTLSHNHPLMDNLNIRVLKYSIIALITLCTVDISYQAISGDCATGFIQSRASFCDWFSPSVILSVDSMR